MIIMIIVVTSVTMGSPQSSDQSVAKAIPQIPQGSSLRRHSQEPIMYLLYFTFRGRRVERLEFSSQSFINKLKTNTKKQRKFGFTIRDSFYSRSLVESWHINESGLFDN